MSLILQPQSLGIQSIIDESFVWDCNWDMYFKDNSKKQLLIIHGGSVYRDDNDYYEALLLYPMRLNEGYSDWKSSLQSELSSEFDIVFPRFPLKENAKYWMWELSMDKIVGELTSDATVVCHSLGTCFILKYLQRHPDVRLGKLILVAPVITEDIIYDFAPQEITLYEVKKQFDNLIIFHSQDDVVVDFTEGERVATILQPNTFEVFVDKGHFNMPRCQEIVDAIIS